DHFISKLTSDEQVIVANVRRLAKEEIGPKADRVAQEDVFAWETFRLLAKEGVIGTAFPVKFGGTDVRQVVRIRIIEELVRVCTASASLITGADLSCRAIVAGASDEIKTQLMPRLCSGEIQTAFALTEPGAGSDV